VSLLQTVSTTAWRGRRLTADAVSEINQTARGYCQVLGGALASTNTVAGRRRRMSHCAACFVDATGMQ
jgi:hypothetical protein